MEETNLVFTFLQSYGYWLIFAWVFADQAALPVPAIPLLIAAGAASAAGQLDLATVVAVATAATLLADSLWYALGRFAGAEAISMVCRLSLEPQSCASTTRRAFGRYGPMTLVIAKYLPGVQTLAPASTGFVRVPFFGFLALDAVGTFVYLGPFIAIGFFFQSEVTAMIDLVEEVSGGIGLGFVLLVLIYGVFKAVQWAIFFRGHRLRRLTVEDLDDRFRRGEPTTVVDLRQRFDYEQNPSAIPGSLRIPIDEVPARRDEIPTRFDVVLVCT